MSRPSVVFAVWGALLLGLAVVLWAIFAPGSALSFVLPAAAVAVLALASAGAALSGERQAARPTPPTASPATATLAIGVALAVLSAAIGSWLTLMSIIPVAFGLFGVIREGRAP